MGYKDDIKMKEDFDLAKTGEFGGFNYYVKKLEEVFWKDELTIKNIDKAVGLFAQNEYAEEIISKRAKLASAYDLIHSSETQMPNQNEIGEEEMEKKVGIINAMNEISKFINLVHDNSDPISSHGAKDVIINNGVAPDAPKGFRARDGRKYVFDDEENFTIAIYEPKNQVTVKYGDVAITTSNELIDMQFGDREGIIISKDSKDCKYYRIPETREKLGNSRSYDLKQEWYTEDLTDKVISNKKDVSQIFSSCITSIEDEDLKESALQDFNYLLAKSKLPTITHIPDNRDKKISKIEGIKESFTQYHDKKETEIAQLTQENLELKEKSKQLNVDQMAMEIENLRKQTMELLHDNLELKQKNKVLMKENSEVKNTLKSERSAWKNIPIFGKLISRKIEAQKHKALPKPAEPISNLPDTLHDVEVKGIDYSQAKVKKSDKEREQRIK